MTATGEKLPEWPDRPFFDDTTDFNWCGYEAKRAAYWEARCRVAVEELLSLYPALELDLRYSDADDDRDALVSRVHGVRKALHRIGPLPERTP